MGLYGYYQNYRKIKNKLIKKIIFHIQGKDK